jgi:hypothetical protein
LSAPFGESWFAVTVRRTGLEGHPNMYGATLAAIPARISPLRKGGAFASNVARFEK